MLDAVTSEKGLGATIDQQLKFSDHIENAVKKANRVLGCLARTFRHLNKDTFLLLYKAMVRPHLEYASRVWCPHLIKDRDLIEQVQRRATRLVPETKIIPYKNRLKELQLPTLNYRRQRTHIIQTFKIIKRIDSVNQDCTCSQCPSKLMFKKPVVPQEGTVKNSKPREQLATDTTSSRPEWLKCGTPCQTTQFRSEQ